MRRSRPIFDGALVMRRRVLQEVLDDPAVRANPEQKRKAEDELASVDYDLDPHNWD